MLQDFHKYTLKKLKLGSYESIKKYFCVLFLIARQNDSTEKCLIEIKSDISSTQTSHLLIFSKLQKKEKARFSS